MYDKYLKGTNGSIKYLSDGKGQRLNLSESYNEPESGMNVLLTIDLDLQLAVERELDKANQMKLIAEMKLQTQSQLIEMSNSKSRSSTNSSLITSSPKSIS